MNVAPSFSDISLYLSFLFQTLIMTIKGAFPAAPPLFGPCVGHFQGFKDSAFNARVLYCFLVFNSVNHLSPYRNKVPPGVEDGINNAEGMELGLVLYQFYARCSRLHNYIILLFNRLSTLKIIFFASSLSLTFSAMPPAPCHLRISLF